MGLALCIWGRPGSCAVHTPGPLPGVSLDLQPQNPKAPERTEQHFPLHPSSVTRSSVFAVKATPARLQPGFALSPVLLPGRERENTKVTSTAVAANAPPVAPCWGSLPLAAGLLPPIAPSAGCVGLGKPSAGPAWVAPSAPRNSRVSWGENRRSAPRSRAWQQDRAPLGIFDVTSWLLPFCGDLFHIQLLRLLLGLCCCSHGRLFLPLLGGRNLFWFVRITPRHCCHRFVLAGCLFSPCKGRGIAAHRATSRCSCRGQRPGSIPELRRETRKASSLQKNQRVVLHRGSEPHTPPGHPLTEALCIRCIWSPSWGAGQGCSQ